MYSSQKLWLDAEEVRDLKEKEKEKDHCFKKIAAHAKLKIQFLKDLE